MTLAALPILAYWVAGTLLTGVSIGSVVVITALQSQISKPIQQLLQLSSDIQSSKVLFERIFQVLDRPNARGCQDECSPEAKVTEGVIEICLSDVSFSYDGSDKSALTSVNLVLPAGKRIFITGESGSGKSTLALMLAGLISPQLGSVSVRLDSGRVVEEMRAVTTLVPQESTLFNLSIRENLAFGSPSSTDEQMHFALRSMELTHLLSKLPGGLDSLVGDRGAKVSGGERQRLAVARSLLADYPIIVFDEFTSGLDDATSQAVFESLLKTIKGKTLIVITHRLPSLRKGDIVVTLHEGSVTDIVQWDVSSGLGGSEASPSLL
ncbi:hypothetical protein GCM10023100_27960 [Actinocorallia cavernae]|uniref:ABC transporter domain-containing protein n=3 Tax=Actinomycetota TaxID=201174 RepID=A0ABP8SNI2_9ACTN